ncbi:MULTISPECIES: DUF432 domain-containing protein [Nitrosopumilus]|nr:MULTISPECIES: DUF432 domain-containing protein [Nitrosopumilus]
MTDKFSDYGKYVISEKLDLELPKTQIHFSRKQDGRLSYHRIDSTNNEIKKSLSPSDSTEIELCPVLPLHLPAKKTHDLIFLRLEESIFVEKNSTANFLIQFPIEIGIFILNSEDKSKELFDCFTCEPMHSRYALYGTPENGSLCMYSKVKLLEGDESFPYIYAKMRVELKNNLSHGVSVGKLVFPITSHTIYYSDNSEVHIDDIKGTIREDTNKEIIKIKKVDYDKKDKDLQHVIYSENQDIGTFVMDKGFS